MQQSGYSVRHLDVIDRFLFLFALVIAIMVQWYPSLCGLTSTVLPYKVPAKLSVDGLMLTG
jgi:hypothetical protein